MSTDEQPYHYGIVIKRYRKLLQWKQWQLAEQWPEGPVSISYVRKVESGERQIADPHLLRKLSSLLHTPLWEFGLSDYDPFHPQDFPGKGISLYPETLESLDQLVQLTWFLRQSAPLAETERQTKRLLKLFTQLDHVLPPSPTMRKRLLYNYGHALQLAGIMYVEQTNYVQAIRIFKNMLLVANEIDDPGLQALASMDIGSELLRLKRIDEAIEHMESARDMAFRASRQTAAVVNSYLARGYALQGDRVHFERAIHTAQSIAENLGDHYGNGTNGIYHRLENILSEQSNGYVITNQPDKVLQMQGVLTDHLIAGNSKWLFANIPLDWAKAYLLKGDIEAGVDSASLVIQRTRDLNLKSPHILSKVDIFIEDIKRTGYGKVKAVQELGDRLREIRR